MTIHSCMLRPLISYSLRRKLWSSRLDAGCLCQLDPSWIIHLSSNTSSTFAELLRSLSRQRDVHLGCQQLWSEETTMLRSSREANKLQVCNKMAARRERGLSQLDHSNSGSNCHKRPLGNPSPSDGVITLGLRPWAITPSSGSRSPAGRLCQLDPSSGDLTIT